MHSPAAPVVFLLDVDNTLLDNDAVTADMREFVRGTLGVEHERRYWAVFEQCRAELGYADYLGALQRYREQAPEACRLVDVSLFFLRYPFADRVFPRALDVVAALREHGPVVILSDGDVVFQPHKIERSGLWAAVDGQVLVYIHKEAMLSDVERRYPAAHYVMVDDKVRILRAMKAVWETRLTTVFVRQGHYAREAGPEAGREADRTIEAIGDLRDLAPQWRTWTHP